MEKWEGKVALVTGVSSGVGKAIVRELVKHGVTVVGMSRRESLMKALADELNKTGKGKFYPKTVDITNEAEVVAVINKMNQKLGGIDILINNAGLFFAPGHLSVGTTEEWRNQLDLEVLALLFITREAIKSMKRNASDGIIININSVAGHYIPENIPPMHTLVKHAMTIVTESLRREILQKKLNIKVTSISPAVIATEKVAGNKDWAEVPKLDLQDVTRAVTFVLSQPPRVQIEELTLRHTGSEI